MSNTAQDRIRSDLTDNDVVLFMKGTPVFPQCGFSAAVVQVLTHLGVKFKGIDVLADPSLRQGIKEFSSWPRPASSASCSAPAAWPPPRRRSRRPGASAAPTKKPSPAGGRGLFVCPR